MGAGIPEIVSRVFNKFRINTVKKKLVWYSFLMAFVMGSFSLYSFFYMQKIAREYNSAMNELYQFNKISVSFNSLNDSMDYALSVSPATFDKDGVFAGLDQTISDARKIEESLNYTGNWVEVASLRGLLETYSEDAGATWSLFEADKGYSEGLSACRQVAKFINKKLNEIMNIYIKESSELYAQIENRNRNMQVNIALTLFILMVFNFLMVVIFSDRIAKPIRSLARKAERIAAGDLDVDEVYVRSNDEVSLLANSFNKMSGNIRMLIRQITEKADVEKKLKEEEMKNLKVANILRDTELKVLQSQINPHFLFNTLNTIARMAMLENADTTLKLIESTSELLRYNLGKIKQGDVTLRNEIENVREYIFILQIRFSDRISFEFDIDDSLLDIPVPYLLLQPLVENAFIHGVEPMEGSGRLELKVYGEDGHVIIKVADNGIGIDGDRLAHIFDEEATSGIGLLNVKKRLEYYFNDTGLIGVWSQKGRGTTVTLRIPVKQEKGETGNV